MDPAERATTIQQLYQQFMANVEHQLLICVARLKGFVTGLKDDEPSLGLVGSLAVPTLYRALSGTLTARCKPPFPLTHFSYSSSNFDAAFQSAKGFTPESINAI